MIGAEVEHEQEGLRQGAEIAGPPPIGSAVEGLPGGLLRYGISPQRGACTLPEDGLLFRRTGFAGFAQAVAAEQEDFGILDQAVRNRCSDGGVEQDIAPV